MWWHEKGHIEFNKLEKYSFLLLLKGYSFDICIFLMLLSFFERFFLSFAVFCHVFYLVMFLYEELWCNFYATKKLRKKMDT